MEWLEPLRQVLERASAPVDFWRFPLETVSNSESGFERTYQGSVIAPRFPVRLAPGESVEVELSLACRDL